MNFFRRSGDGPRTNYAGGKAISVQKDRGMSVELQGTKIVPHQAKKKHVQPNEPPAEKQNEIYHQKASFDNLRKHQFAGAQGPQGVNTAQEIYVVSSVGTPTTSTQAGNWWTLNLSTQAGQQKRLLSFQDASTFLVNFAQDNYPSRIDIKVAQLPGTLDASGNPTHSLVTLVPSSPAVPVYNNGGIIGYNIHYSLVSGQNTWDISSIPQLTFDITVGTNMVPAQYPLAQGITLHCSITHVIF